MDDLELKISNYPPDVEPLPGDHEFFDELCSLIEEYEEKTDRTREELLYDTRALAEYWITHLHVAGSTW